LTLWVALAGVALAAAFVLNGITLRILKPARLPVERTPEVVGVPAEEIEIPCDGRTLRGWYLDGDGPDSKPVVVLAHGWGANSGTVLPLGAALHDLGLDVVVFDFRQHGRSDGAARVTVLDYAEDLDAVVRWVRETDPSRRVVVIGHSMGAAAAILAAADGMPADAIMTVAAPADFVDVTASYLGPGAVGLLMLLLTGPFFLLHVRVWWTQLAPDRHIGEVGVPLTIVHGDRDRRVPVSHTRRLAQAAGVEPVVLEDVGHRDILHNPEFHALALDWAERF